VCNVHVCFQHWDLGKALGAPGLPQLPPATLKTPPPPSLVCCFFFLWRLERPEQYLTRGRPVLSEERAERNTSV